MTEAIKDALRRGRPDNPSSWHWVVAFYEYVTAGPSGPRYLPLLRLAQHIAGTPVAEQFQAGQSLHSLLISTKAQNGLDETDPYILLDVEQTGLIRLEFWRAEREDGLEVELSCPEADLIDRLLPLLERLRAETGPGERAV